MTAARTRAEFLVSLRRLVGNRIYLAPLVTTHLLATGASAWLLSEVSTARFGISHGGLAVVIVVSLLPLGNLAILRRAHLALLEDSPSSPPRDTPRS